MLYCLQECGKPNKEEIEKFISNGKVCFGMAVDQMEVTVPVLMKALMEKNK